MEFLYFPEDKTEYIPAVIMLVIFMIGAAIAMYLIYKKSKRDEARFEETYQINKTENKSAGHKKQ
jgi:uncharacterized membrane protein affecting hemolysin expression